MSAWLTSWITALRIARREVLRNRSRNILIVAMLMLPVFGVTALETVLNSTTDLSTQEQLDRTVGTADAWIIRADTQAQEQNTSVPANSLPAKWDSEATDPNYVGTQATTAQLADPSGISAVLPNATLLPVRNAWGVFMHGPAGYATPEYTQVDLTKPQLGGAYDLLSGHVPETATQVDLAPRAMKEFGAQIGSTITLTSFATPDGEPAAFTVVGEMHQPGDTTADQVFALPTAPDSTGGTQLGWFVLNPGGVSWSQVQAMNKSGYVVTSREVALDPPSAAQVPYNKLDKFAPPVTLGSAAVNAAVLGIGVGIALLEVVLLAGPAFAVSARRREREYAIIAAAGAGSGHLRRIVLADGLVLGAIAGLLGAGLGFGAGAAALPFIAHLAGNLPGHVHVDLLRVLGVAVLAVFLGLCSAWMPARSVAGRDVLATLNGRRAATSTRVRVERVITGVLLIAVGACSVFLDPTMSPAFGAVFILGGVALMEIGGILCTPAVIHGVARLGRIMPLGPRLALRDSARHTARTTPAVAAMFAAVAGAVAAGGWLDSSMTQARDAYQPALMSNQVAVTSVAGQKQASQIVSKLSAIMPITGSTVIQDIDAANAAGTSQWQLSALPGPTAMTGLCAPGTVTRPGALSTSSQLEICNNGLFGTGMAQDPIGGPAVLKELTGIGDANADAALSEGGAVVFAPGLVQNGKVTLIFSHGFENEAKPGDKSPTSTYVTKYYTVPAVYENPQGIPSPGAVISPALARRMGASNEGTSSLVMDLRSHITPTQDYGAGLALNAVGNPSGLTVEDGYNGHYGLANLAVLAIALLLAIGAAAIATGLALADGRADHETLTAVGGSPWTRRWLAGSTALVITGLGIVIGVPIGFLIAEGLVRVSNLGQVALQPDAAAKAFIVPWLNLGVLVIAVPVITALGAMLLARSRTPRIRRIEF